MFRIIINKTAFIIIIFVSAVLSCLYGETNLLLNPGFETGVGREEKPAYWQYDLHNSSKDYTEIIWQKKDARSGSYCILINNKKPNDARIIQNLNLKAESIYKASCWIKIKDIGLDSIGANISIRAATKTSRYIVGTSDDWQNIEVFIKTGEQTDSLFLTIGIGSYGSVNTGKAWIDDVKLEKVSSIPKEADVISLQKEKKQIHTDKSVFTKGMDSVLFIYLGFLVFLAVFFVIGRFKKNKQQKIIKSEKTSSPESENTSFKGQ